MIAITFALPAESSGIIGKLEPKRTRSHGAVKVLLGKIGVVEVAIFHTGVGRKRCQQSIEPFLQTIRPQMLISSGFAGSLTDQLSVGDVILAENFSDPAAINRVMEGGVPATFKLSHANTGSRELSPPLNGRVRIVKLVTVDRMVDHAEERARIAKEHSAAAIDMETDVIAEACAGIAIPMISLRVISDSPVAPFPVPAEVLFDIKRQRTSFGRLIPYVLAHPSAIGRLSRFADQINRARTILTDAVLNVVTNIRSA